MAQVYWKGKRTNLNAWNKKPGIARFLTRVSILLHARAARGHFGPLQKFYDELEPGRHRSHVTQDIKRGEEFLSVMGIKLIYDEFGFKIETACGFGEYLSKKQPPKKKKEARKNGRLERCGKTGRFFWQETEGYGEEAERRDDEEYKSFL